MGDSVFSEIDTALVLYLLHLERHKHRKAFGGKGTKGVDFSRTNGKNGIQPVELLKFQRGKLAHMLSRNREHRFGVAVKLLFIVGGDYHSDNRKHHSLISRGKVVEKFFGFFTLELHIIGHDRREIVVCILASLPICDICFHA